MNAKISAMHDQHSKLQARRIQAKKDLISLKNDIASKEEFAKLQQKKYDAMKLELEQRGRQIKEMEEEVHEYEKLGPQAATLNSHDIMIEKFLAEPNVKKELNQLLHEENRKVDTKFVIGKISSTVDEEGEVPPHAETYAKSMVEAVTIKFANMKKKRREDKKGQKEMEDDDSKKMSFIAQFRINKDTTFVQLKLAACNFWETHKQGCSYFLTDEAGAQLPEGCKIEEYFKSQLQDIHNILLILKPQEPSKNLNAGMIEAISNRDQQTQGQVGQLNFTRTKKVEVDGYGEFFDNFPGMKNFINEDKLKEKKKSKFVSDEDKRTRFIDDNHCCVAFFIFLIMLISVIAVPLDRKVTYDYNLWSSINQLLLIGDAFASDSKSYNNVLSMQNTMDYLTNVMVPNLFLTTLPPVDVLSPAIFQQNVYIGPLRIRQVRTKQMPSCVSIPASTQEIYCYYDSYDKDTRDTTTFGDGSQSWQIFHTAEENGISSKMSSTTSSYDGSGYVIDFDMTATNSSMAISTLNSTYNDGFLDFGTRAIFVDANLYNPTLNRLIQISLGFEFTIGGYVIPLANEISIYRQIRYVTEHLHVRYEIVQGMCAVLLLIFLIYMTATDEQGRRKFNWQYWTTFPAASTLILIIVVFMGINSNKTMRDFNIDLNSLINTKTFFDSKDLANAYWYSLFYETLGVFVASVRIMYFFRLSPNFVLIVNTISKAGRIFIQYIITLAPILVSFAVIGMLLWGTISQDFNIRGNAFISVMALALGHFDSQILADADIYLTAVLLTLYYFFLVFFLITVFTSLTIDMYRVTKMEHSAEEGGKPKDFKLFAWLFGWVPSKRIMQVVEFFKKRFGKKDEAKDKKGGKEGSKEGDKEPIITKENKDTVIDSARKEKLIEMKRAI